MFFSKKSDRPKSRERPPSERQRASGSAGAGAGAGAAAGAGIGSRVVTPIKRALERVAPIAQSRLGIVSAVMVMALALVMAVAVSMSARLEGSTPPLSANVAVPVKRVANLPPPTTTAVTAPLSSLQHGTPLSRAGTALRAVTKFGMVVAGDVVTVATHGKKKLFSRISDFVEGAVVGTVTLARTVHERVALFLTPAAYLEVERLLSSNDVSAARTRVALMQSSEVWRRNWLGRTLLQTVVLQKYCRPKTADESQLNQLVLAVLQRGGDGLIDVQDGFGENVLHYIARRNDASLLSALSSRRPALSLDKAMKSLNVWGLTPLQVSLHEANTAVQLTKHTPTNDSSAWLTW